MDFMKVVNEAVREIKREVNLKVLKVPEIEQKVLDATDDEPWGPHGTVLAEIAQATKKFAECQMVMNVLWTRLTETDKNWRLVYKALAVIEYLVAHGSERAVDDIIEHTFQISSLSSFEYVEPNGKDVGINVRKKAETIVGLLNNRDKIQEAREKAAANRDKYFGLSSTGITYKSGSASYGTSSMRSNDRYGGFGSSGDGDRFSDSYRDNDRYVGKSTEKEYSGKSSRGVKNENQASKVKGSTRYDSKDRDETSSNVSKSSSNFNKPAKYSSMSSQSSDVPSNKYDDDFDDFDPRGTSTSKPASGSSKQVDLFGDSLIGDLLDAPASVPVETPAVNSGSSDVDLFADADFVSVPSQADKGAASQTKTSIDLFASQPGIPPVTSPAVDLFATSNDPVVQAENKAPKKEPTNTNVIDPFGDIPLNSFDGSDTFGSFTSEPDLVPTESTQNSGNDDSVNKLNGKSVTESKPSPKKENFQVKSGIWADSLSRGLIDLNITAPKKVSLTDVGIVGGLSDGSDEREKGPPASYYMGMNMSMGRAMGAGSGLGRSDFGSSQASGGDDDIFSNFSSQQYQYGGYKK